jgi:hypothetical protein
VKLLVDIDLHWHDLRHEAAWRWLTYLNVTDEELRKTMQEKLWTRR